MSLYDQPNLSTGIDDALISTAQAVPSFPIMILVFIYLVILLGGTNNQKRRTGSADYPFWTVLAGITTSFSALLMTVGEGLINLTTLSIVFAITILSGIWFFLSKTKGEI